MIALSALNPKALGAIGLVLAGLVIFGLYWRGEAYQARAEAELARAQISMLTVAVESCSASVDQAKRVGEAAIAGTAELVAAARRLKQPARHTVERIETILERPAPLGAGCDQAWDAIEKEQKAGPAQ